MAFTLADRGRQLIAAVNAAALAAGISPGLALADARARLPDLLAAPHDPYGDAAFLDWLAQGATRWTPMVAARPPYGLVLDITGCAHLFGGEASLVADVATRCARLGLTVQPALAATPAAAMALARFGGHRLADLPLAALADDAAVLIALRRAGLACVADVQRLPRAALAARFGAGLLAALDRLTESAAEPLVPLLPQAPVQAEVRFAAPIATVDAVLARLDALLLKVMTRLAERGEGGRQFALALYRADGHVARLAVDTALPSRDARAVRRLFAERLAALNDPLDPGFGYDLLRLVVPLRDRLDAAQLGLNGGQLADTEVTALVDRLTARLGQPRIRRLARADRHLPEQAAFDLPFNAPPLPLAPPRPLDAVPDRPIHLFDPPQPIEVIAEVPDGPPRRFRWRRQLHDVAAHEGPERIAAEWWRRRDNAGLTRDYYRVENAAGQRFWLFRHGLYGVESAGPRWFLHGLFA